MKKLIFLAFPLLFLASSCKVDFSPNAEWKDVPVVWCVLDQLDDTTWVRVQRCYIGNDNLYNFTQVSDSIYYAQDEIAVTIEKWKGKPSGSDEYNLVADGDKPVDTKTFTYTLRDIKERGLFASGMQPVYYAVTKNWLKPEFVYKLVVSNTESGEPVATATTLLVGTKIDRSNPYKLDLTDLEQPNPQIQAHKEFRFASNGKCMLVWKSLVRGRLYQPVVRFYYYHKYLGPDNQYHNDMSKKYSIDVSAQESEPQIGNPAEMSTYVDASFFYSSIREAIVASGDNEPKGFCDTVDILMNVCNEDLNAYMSSSRPSNTVVQDRVVYSNINDGAGVGVFAARRTPHVFYDENGAISSTSFIFTVPTNNESGGAYRQGLKDLGVGFER